MNNLLNPLEIPCHEPKATTFHLADTAYQTETKDKLSLWINNLKIYCSLLIEKEECGLHDLTGLQSLLI